MYHCTVKINADKTRKRVPQSDDDDVADVALAAIAPATLEFSVAFHTITSNLIGQCLP